MDLFQFTDSEKEIKSHKLVKVLKSIYLTPDTQSVGFVLRKTKPLPVMYPRQRTHTHTHSSEK